jgi:CrcB protein
MAHLQSISLRRRILAVLAGGFCGTLARYLVSLFVQSQLGKGWPYDILLINITGAFLLSFITSLADATVLIGPTRRLFLNVGFLGAYTTFSSLALGADQLFLRSAWFPGLLYLFLSIAGGGCAVLLGDWLAQWLFAHMLHTYAIQRRRSVSLPVLHITEQNSEKSEHVDMQDDVIST